MYFKFYFLLYLSLLHVMYTNMAFMTANIKSTANIWHIFKNTGNNILPEVFHPKFIGSLFCIKY